MLVQLAIRDIVLIDRLELCFRDGLSVLTGETGTGKSILLDSFALALGGRGDGALVRNGELQGQVTAVFDCPLNHPARLIAENSGINTEGDLILRRLQMADGRTRAFINDQPVSVQVLRSVGAALVEIHGQHDERALLDSASHRGILDTFGDLSILAQSVVEKAAEFKRLQQALTEQQLKIETARKESDFLRFAVEELAVLAASPGEEQALAERRQTMMQAEKIAQDIAEALEIVAGQNSPIPQISAALRRLERRREQAPHLIEPSVKALDEALLSFDASRTALEEALRLTEFEPQELEKVEERLFALRAAARKYNVSVDALGDVQRQYSEELNFIEIGEQRLAELTKAVADAEAAYINAAGLLSQGRKKTAVALDAAVQAELPPLKLENARFITDINCDETSRDPAGFDRVEFWTQTNPGTKPGPMMKIASGGELSRFMLALKVVLADKGSAPTLIFDEIDTGVGGAVADAIGQRLARLSRKVQVIAVTHAPQVAARATHHFLIEKKLAPDAARTVTSVTSLDIEPRREEIARMLAGATISDEARAAATHLLQAAGPKALKENSDRQGKLL